VTPKKANKETLFQAPLTEAAPVKTGETPLEVVDTGVGITITELTEGATGTTVVYGTGVFNDSGQLGRPLAQPITVMTIVEEAPVVSGAGDPGTIVVPTANEVVVG